MFSVVYLICLQGYKFSYCNFILYCYFKIVIAFLWHYYAYIIWNLHLFIDFIPKFLIYDNINILICNLFGDLKVPITLQEIPELIGRISKIGSLATGVQLNPCQLLSLELLLCLYKSAIVCVFQNLRNLIEKDLTLYHITYNNYSIQPWQNYNDN